MANAPFNNHIGLDELAPVLYANLDYVLREPTGALNAIMRDDIAARGTVGQTTRYFRSTPNTTRQVVPAMTPPDLGAQTYENREVELEQAETADIKWNGEEEREMATNGVGISPMISASVDQSIRAIVNQMEAYTCRKLAEGAGSGQEALTGTLFDGSTEDAPTALKHFIDTGAPTSQLSMIIDTNVGLDLRKIPNLNLVNEAGNADLLRSGILGNLSRFDFRESAGIYQHTAGDAAGATMAAPQSKGDTSVVLAAAGTGAILAGDLIKIDGVEYGVRTGVADVSVGGTVVIEAPGLKDDVAAVAVDVVSAVSRNIALDRNSFILSTRALDAGDDIATDSMTITDANTGFSLFVREYKGYYLKKIEIGAVWGGAVIKPEAVRIMHNA
jgi:hypothetical protein